MKNYPMPKNSALIVSVAHKARAFAENDYAYAVRAHFDDDARIAEARFAFAERIIAKLDTGKKVTQAEWNRLCAI